MKRIFTKALCLVCAGALALSLAACGGKADSAASSTASSSALGSASDYDYQNFNYSDGLDEKGYWEGIRALDYVTLPEDFASVAIKRSDVEPTSEEVEEQISNLLSQYSSTEHITDRAAADGDTVDINYVGSVNNVEFTGGSAENYDLTLGSGTTGFTEVTSDLYYQGGYLATLKIPSIDVNVKVYEGTGSAVLRKGAGHFEDTSVWAGNVCLAAHNRGVNDHFGEIHTLDVGDKITLTTKLGKRTYAVTSVNKISELDNSLLSPTAENCITLFTCVRNQSAYRWAVRAVEVS